MSSFGFFSVLVRNKSLQVENMTNLTMINPQKEINPQEESPREIKS